VATYLGKVQVTYGILENLGISKLHNHSRSRKFRYFRPKDKIWTFETKKQSHFGPAFDVLYQYGHFGPAFDVLYQYEAFLYLRFKKA
jgi:hypothetical protein